jgi:deazaflavin-dependent oxidoreductase (nitroreductase family)
MPLPQAIGRINKVVTNRVTGLVAGRLPGFGIITHRGRQSGRTYHTPINVFRRPGGYIVALTYGQGDWVKNVLASGDAQIRSRGRTHHVDNPRLVNDPMRSDLPLPVRGILGVLNVDDFLLVDDSAGGSSATS